MGGDGDKVSILHNHTQRAPLTCSLYARCSLKNASVRWRRSCAMTLRFISGGTTSTSHVRSSTLAGSRLFLDDFFRGLRLLRVCTAFARMKWGHYCSTLHAR